MEKDLKFALLLDIYSGLLTEKQAQAMDYYYNSDYSLGEIAELMDITRQGVRDFVKRGEAILLAMDEKLGLMNRFKKLDVICADAQDILYLNSRLSASSNIQRLANEILSTADFIRNGDKA